MAQEQSANSTRKTHGRAARRMAHLGIVSLRPAPIINGIIPERGKLLREVAYCTRSGFVEDEARAALLVVALHHPRYRVRPASDRCWLALGATPQ